MRQCSEHKLLSDVYRDFYINVDIVSSNFYLFADDTNIFFESQTLCNLCKKVNNELKYVKRWLDANKLILSVSKSNYIIFHSKTTTIPGCLPIKIGKNHISRAKYVKFLGILLDEHLSWKYHLSELTKKLARTCGILFKVRNLLPTSTLVSVYNALFLSFLQYCMVVWGQAYASYTEPIFKMQKRAVRAISNQSYLAHSLPIFRELTLLRLSDIFKLKLLTFVFESTNKIAPVCFHNFFSSNSSIHHYETRQSVRGDFYLVRKNTVQYGVKCIQYMGATLWNNLPVELRHSTSKFSFKKKVKVHLLHSI